jgi:hypothetical protein
MLRYTPLFLLLLAGCTKPEPVCYPVDGTAEFYGKAAEGFTVEFASQAEETKGLSAMGKVGADGKFTLKTTINGKEKDGAVAGLHKVVVVPPPSGTGPAVIVPLPPRYGDYNTTPLRFEVKPDQPNAYKIPLDQ